MKMVNAKGEAVYFNRAWKHGKETWVVQGIGETLVIGVTARSAGAAHSPSCRRLRSTSLAWGSKPPLEP